MRYLLRGRFRRHFRRISPEESALPWGPGKTWFDLAKYLLPWNCGIPTWFAFWSHKGLRWTGPFLLLAAWISCGILALESPFYRLLGSGILFTFLLAGFDLLAERAFPKQRFKLLRFVRYFYSMNLALFLGAIEFCKGIQNSVWEPTRRNVENKVGDEAVSLPK